MNKVVTLPNYGKVKCCLVSRANEAKAKPVMSFLGIPYAQPPVGKLRFMPPKKALPWSGVLAKKSQRKIPMQMVATWQMADKFIPFKHNFSQSTCDEDCLYLNVFVPENATSTKLPVMIWIYGGAMQIGPNFFIDGTALAGMNGVIVVVPNYRVNVFGFLSMGPDSKCKGNLGLLDQLQAFRWVKENIEHFGGDPDNVTLFGESAGAISISMHMMSPLSRGLFHKAISHSGVATCSKMYINDQSRAMKRFLEILDINDTDEDIIIKKLQSLPAAKILHANFELQMARFVWLPNFDNHFFPDSPENLFKKGDIFDCPYLLGYNNDEGAWTMQYLNPHFFTGYTEKMFYETGKSLLKSYDKSIDARKTLPVLLKKYTDQNEVKVPEKMKFSKAFGDMFGDCIFVNHVIAEVERRTGCASPTFLYRMTLQPKMHHDLNYGPVEARKADYVRCDHTDDIPLTFGYPYLPDRLKEGYKFSEDEQRLSARMMTYLSNFTKTGDPNKGEVVDFQWPRYTPEGRHHLVIDCPLAVASGLCSSNLETFGQQMARL